MTASDLYNNESSIKFYVDNPRTIIIEPSSKVSLEPRQICWGTRIYRFRTYRVGYHLSSTWTCDNSHSHLASSQGFSILGTKVKKYSRPDGTALKHTEFYLVSQSDLKKISYSLTNDVHQDRYTGDHQID